MYINFFTQVATISFNNIGQLMNELEQKPGDPLKLH